ncbi:hypothetical protein [Nocardia thraciensis]
MSIHSIALPTMCRGHDWRATVDWRRFADEGPVSSAVLDATLELIGSR